MAPEQLRGLHAQVNEQTDVFALGATLYHILTGEPPRVADDIRTMWARKTALLAPQQIVQGAKVPAGLSAIALRAMSEDPSDRYASVEELEDEVLCWLHGVAHFGRIQTGTTSAMIARSGR